MDVTYATVNKPRRGPAPSETNPAPSGRDPASLPGSPSLTQGSIGACSDQAPADGTYEVVTPQGDPGSCPRLGFNFRIAKPKGPREPPAEWSQV